MWTGQIRLAGVGDIAFLREMLYEAAYWRGSQVRPELEAALAAPELAKLLENWGRRVGDAAVIALSREELPLGAAWYRYWSEDDHSYGFVAEDVPELGIGVRKEARGQGVGTALLRALLGHARSQGVQSLSLSVEVDNPASLMYQKLGFRKVEVVGESWTMILNL